MKQLIAVCDARSNQDFENNQIQDILNNVFNWDKLDEGEDNKEYKLYSWKLNNKYYEAIADICILKSKSLVNKNFAENTQAALLYFNSKKDGDGLKNISSWLPILDEWDPDIKMIVCEKCSSNDETESDYVDRVSVQEWCIKNNFELVELNPSIEDYDDYEDYGTERIINALNAHMWPNMSMKSEAKSQHISGSTGMLKTKDKQNNLKESSLALNETVEQAARLGGLLMEDKDLDALVGDGETETFEKLFEQLSVMKNNASKIPEEKRAEYAENVVKAFWTAIGGDEDEFLENSSSDNEI